jgi:hypothetical protein
MSLVDAAPQTRITPYTLYPIYYLYDNRNKLALGFTTNKNDKIACTDYLGMISTQPLVFSRVDELRAAKQRLSDFVRDEFRPHRRSPSRPLEQEAAMYWISRTGGVIDRSGTGDETVMTVGRKFHYLNQNLTTELLTIIAVKWL